MKLIRTKKKNPAFFTRGSYYQFNLYGYDGNKWSGSYELPPKFCSGSIKVDHLVFLNGGRFCFLEVLW